MNTRSMIVVLNYSQAVFACVVLFVCSHFEVGVAYNK